MSLFQNDGYQWRETYFVYLQRQHLPSAQALQHALDDLGSRYRLQDLRSSDDGAFESVTVISPDDYAAMDITYVDGEEVTQQREEVQHQLGHAVSGTVDREKLQRLKLADARFEVYHFEQLVPEDIDEEGDDFFLDPGSLLIVLETIARLCDGVVVDPQAGCLL